jgi:hypothetical protein
VAYASHLSGPGTGPRERVMDYLPNIIENKMNSMEKKQKTTYS